MTALYTIFQLFWKWDIIKVNDDGLKFLIMINIQNFVIICSIIARGSRLIFKTNCEFFYLPVFNKIIIKIAINI